MEKLRAGLYGRVSTTEQAEQGYSIPAQLREMREFAERKGWQVIDEYVDRGYTGRNDRRPQFRRMMADAKAGKLQVIGGVAVLVVLIACGVSAFILVNRSPSTGEPVFLGASLTPPATRPHRVSAPIAPPVFEEAFDDNSREWSVWEDEHGTKGAEDGVYYITVSDTGWASWGTSDRTFDDFVVQVEAWVADGPDDNGYGLVFRYQDNDNFYYYEVSSDGYYSIGKMAADEWEILVGWSESDLIRLGRQTNTLSVECDSPRMTFIVNGYQIEELTDDDFEAGSLGFIAEAGDEPGVRVHFDNLKVWATE